MCKDSNINQFIPLHFYEVTEKLPDNDEWKIVICFDKETDEYDFKIAYYSEKFELWFDEQSFIAHTIAWASFSPEWVIGRYPGKWGTQ